MRLVFTSILIGSTMFAAFRWLLLYSVLKKAAAKLDLSWVSSLQMDSPAFWPAFWDSAGQLVNPRTLFHVCGGFNLLILAAAVALVAYFWKSTRFPFSSEDDSLIAAALVILPAIVGLSLVPGAIARNSQALAEIGLSSPEIVAAGVGEGFAPFALGLACSVALGGAYLWLRRKRAANGDLA